MESILRRPADQEFGGLSVDGFFSIGALACRLVSRPDSFDKVYYSGNHDSAYAMLFHFYHWTRRSSRFGLCVGPGMIGFRCAQENLVNR